MKLLALVLTINMLDVLDVRRTKAGMQRNAW